MKKVYYIGFYSDPVGDSLRKTAPAADTKMSYIIESIKKLGYDVEVLSFCVDDSRGHFFEKKSGYRTVINGTKVTFFTNYASKYRILRFLGRWIAWLNIKKILHEKCLETESIILIYHSLGLFNVIKFLFRKKKKFVLEMEEIYADVIGKQRLRKKEISYAQKANAFIFPTQLLDTVINIKKKPSVIIHGTYQVEQDRKCRNAVWKLYNANTNDIHCVYAGTFDPRKGGAAAAAVAEFLPSNYHIHIIGFGSNDEVKKMNYLVKELKQKSKAKITYEGLLTGEDYIRFIQSCDIGFSTQNPNAVFNATSFPSKILSYLANGLRVVSIRIPAIEQSAVGDILYYYKNQRPKEIADAILSIDIQNPYDGRKVIEQLAARLERELEGVLQ